MRGLYSIVNKMFRDMRCLSRQQAHHRLPHRAPPPAASLTSAGPSVRPLLRASAHPSSGSPPWTAIRPYGQASKAQAAHTESTQSPPSDGGPASYTQALSQEQLAAVLSDVGSTRWASCRGHAQRCTSSTCCCCRAWQWQQLPTSAMVSGAEGIWMGGWH